MFPTTNNQNGDTTTSSETPSESITIPKLMRVFKTKLFFMFAIVFSISYLLLASPDLAPFLMATSRNIPSAFTAVFVHKDITHLGASLALTLAVLILYSLSNAISKKKEDNFIIIAIWISTVFASLAFVNLTPNTRIGGSSGLVSAFLSGATVNAYLNAWTDPVPRNKIAQITIGTFLVAAFAASNLNVDSATNVTVHLSASFNMAVIVLAKRFLSSFFSKKD